MPQLQGKAKDLYIHAHGQAVYDLYYDVGGTLHGIHLCHPDQVPGPFLRRPDHDVESVFWTLFSSLLRVCPSDGPTINAFLLATIESSSEGLLVPKYEKNSSAKALLQEYPGLLDKPRDASLPRFAVATPLDRMISYLGPDSSLPVVRQSRK